MRKRLILLVDDDRLVLATLGQGLRSAGYDVVEASSGEDAMAIVGKDGIDLAILDINMPGKSGLEVAHWLREQSEVPFIFLTAHGDSTVVQQGVSEGALTYLVKPIDLSQLVPAIEAALSRADEIRQLRETEKQLSTALSQSRYTSMAIGLVMERQGLSEIKAFELLRSYARSQRRKVQDIAEEIISAEEVLNRIIGPRDKSPKSGEESGRRKG